MCCIGNWFCSIFGDVGDYDPTETTKEYGKKSRTKEKEREKERKKSRSSSSYFNKSADGEDDVSIKLHQDTVRFINDKKKKPDKRINSCTLANSRLFPCPCLL